MPFVWTDVYQCGAKQVLKLYANAGGNARGNDETLCCIYDHWLVDAFGGGCRNFGRYSFYHPKNPGTWRSGYFSRDDRDYFDQYRGTFRNANCFGAFRYKYLGYL